MSDAPPMTPSSWASIAVVVLASMLAASCGEQKVEPKPTATASPDHAGPEAPAQRADTDLLIVVRDIVQLPATTKGAPPARIDTLVHAGDGSPRLFAVDMDGVIHVIERDQLLPTPFLDMGNDSRADLRFGTDAAGEIYLLTKRDGMIRRLSIAEH